MHWPSLPRPGVLLNEPSLHGSGAEEPCSQYEPATQSKHAVWPLWFMKLPAAQLAHVPSLACGCTVPGVQALIDVADSGHAWPWSHAVQFACDTKPEPLPKDPSAHGAALELTLPASQK